MHFAEIPYPAMGAALDAGTVDAIRIVEPFWSLTGNRFRGFALGDSGIADRFLLSGYIASQNWLRHNGNAARRYADAIREVAPWANDHNSQSAAILARFTNYSPTLQRALLQPLVDAGVRYGAVAAAFPASDIIFTGTRRGG